MGRGLGRDGGRGGVAAAALASALTLLIFGGATPSQGIAPSGATEEVWQLVVEGPAYRGGSAEGVIPSPSPQPGERAHVPRGNGAAVPLLVVPLGSDGRFGIGYRHSVEKTPVVEWFQVSRGPDADGIREGFPIALTAIEYRSFGAGLPTDAPPGARFRRLPDRFLIEGLHTPVPSLVVRPLALTDHVLIVGDNCWELGGLAPEGAPLRLYAKGRREAREGAGRAEGGEP